MRSAQRAPPYPSGEKSGRLTLHRKVAVSRRLGVYGLLTGESASSSSPNVRLRRSAPTLSRLALLR